MRRREFITISGAAAAWPLAARAQQPAKMKRIASVTSNKVVDGDPADVALLEELKRLGYVKPKFPAFGTPTTLLICRRLLGAK